MTQTQQCRTDGPDRSRVAAVGEMQRTRSERGGHVPGGAARRLIVAWTTTTTSKNAPEATCWT